jgi:prophage regulatory protein
MDSLNNNVGVCDQLLRIRDVVKLTTLSKSCINLWVAQDRFPKPLALSNTLKVWRSSDIRKWTDCQFSSSSQSNGRSDKEAA